MFATRDRGTLRAVFFRAWRRHLDRAPLEGAEPLIVQVAQRHPEYHGLLERAEDRDYFAELGETNPFLHMAMHIAIEEGLTLDQPHGVRDLYRRLLAREPDEHRLQHRLMDCLAETLWRAQREQRAFEPAGYLDCLRGLDRE